MPAGQLELLIRTPCHLRRRSRPEHSPGRTSSGASPASPPGPRPVPPPRGGTRARTGHR